MSRHQLAGFYYLAIFLALISSEISCLPIKSKLIKSAVYLSPPLIMSPGIVQNKFYYDIRFPKGHIGIKSFNAELVDEAGVSIPLYQTYVHHWAVFRYYQRIKPQNHSDHISLRNNGVCPGDFLGQYFGMASETRKTDTRVPDPYAIEVGNRAQVPPGYYEGWVLNIHAIDMRGVEDRMGCAECRCSLYNVTVDATGTPLSPGYEGGFRCCYDQTVCKVKDGFVNSQRTVIYLRYTVKWVDWDESVLPVRYYIFDVTDTPKISHDSAKPIEKHDCKLEYEVKRCESSRNGCIDTKRTSVVMPQGGYVVYGVAFQYPGGIGATIYRKDGRVICSSKPIYGTGTETGNEAGYIVGMSTCYPHPGSVQITNGETLVIESNYSSSVQHTGAAGFIKIMVADQVPN